MRAHQKLMKRGRTTASLVTLALQPKLCAVLLISLFLTCLKALGAAGESDAPVSPQQLYNRGTEKFREGKLREAEAALQTAVVSQNEKVQIPALYNLGHVRFQEGVEELKAGPNSKASDAAAQAACEN